VPLTLRRLLVTIPTPVRFVSRAGCFSWLSFLRFLQREYPGCRVVQPRQPRPRHRRSGRRDGGRAGGGGEASGDPVARRPEAGRSALRRTNRKILLDSFPRLPQNAPVRMRSGRFGFVRTFVESVFVGISFPSEERRRRCPSLPRCRDLFSASAGAPGRCRAREPEGRAVPRFFSAVRHRAFPPWRGSSPPWRRTLPPWRGASVLWHGASPPCNGRGVPRHGAARPSPAVACPGTERPLPSTERDTSARNYR
jgi:hypothetical protein